MPFVLSSFYMYEQFNTATSGFSLKKESLSAKSQLLTLQLVDLIITWYTSLKLSQRFNLPRLKYMNERSLSNTCPDFNCLFTMWPYRSEFNTSHIAVSWEKIMDINNNSVTLENWTLVFDVLAYTSVEPWNELTLSEGGLLRLSMAILRLNRPCNWWNLYISWYEFSICRKQVLFLFI